MNSYVFGPVPSRRLGRSLGVDLVPYKTCSFDCIYCQLGKTNRKTMERALWVPVDMVIEQISRKLPSKPDYITFGGSGEPTLYSGIGDVISRIKEIADIPVAVLTNGSLLWQREVRDQIRRADLILPSLDAGDAATFAAINRPHPDLQFDRMVQGLIDLRQEFSGTYWLEVLLVDGLNASSPELDNIVSVVERINPDRIQINTVVRPPAEPGTRGLSQARLQEAARRFGPRAEVIADTEGVFQSSAVAAGQQDILSMLARRPCSVDDIAQGLSMHRGEVLKQVDELVRQGKIQAESRDGRIYYMVRS